MSLLSNQKCSFLIGIHLLVDSTVVFWKSKEETGNPVAFQLGMTASSEADISSLNFDSLHVFDAEDNLLFIVKHVPSVSEIDSRTGRSNVQHVDVGHLSLPISNPSQKEISANLKWSLGTSIVFKGIISSSIPREVKVRQPGVSVVGAHHDFS